MASTHEYKNFNDDVQKVYWSEFVTGSIVTIDSVNNQADVTIDGTTYTSVPIFYHCKDATTVDDGHKAFSPSDSVLILAEKDSADDSPSYTIVGFAEGDLVPCVGPLLVIKMSASPDADSLCFVWDIANNTYASMDSPANPGTPLTYPCRWSEISAWVDANQLSYDSGHAADVGYKYCYGGDTPYSEGLDLDVDVYSLDCQIAGVERPEPSADPWEYEAELTDSTSSPCGTMENYSLYDRSATHGYPSLESINDYGLITYNNEAEHLCRNHMRYGYINTVSGNGSVACIYNDYTYSVSESYDHSVGVAWWDSTSTETYNGQTINQIETPIGSFNAITVFRADDDWVYDRYDDDITSVASKDITVIIGNKYDTCSYFDSWIGYNVGEDCVTFPAGSAEEQTYFWHRAHGFYNNVMFQIYFYADVHMDATYSVNYNGSYFPFALDGDINYSTTIECVASCQMHDDEATNHNPTDEPRNTELEAAVENLFEEHRADLELSDVQLRAGVFSHYLIP